MPEAAAPLQDVEGLKSQVDQQDVDTRFAALRLAQEVREVTGFQSRPMRDITKDFIAASQLLDTGQLIKDEYFTLYEAVGALEIMDKKMDTGVVLPGKSPDPDMDPSASLTAAEVMWVMDEILRLEIIWLEEYPLSQTTFTSVHIDRILDPENKHPFPFELLPSSQETITNQILHPYCLATIKCASMVLELIRSQGFYEEEDFISHTFGRELLPDMTTDEAFARLEEASQWVLSNVLDTAMRDALEVRLTFRRTFMKSIFGQLNGWNNMIKALEKDLDSGRAISTPIPACFTEKVQRHLATSTPPRPPFEMTWDEARIKWKKLCSDVASAPQMTSFWIRQSPACLHRAIWAFAARRPSALPRSIIQDIMFVDGKIADDTSHFDLLLSDLRELVLPGDSLVDPESFQVEAVSSIKHKCSRIMEQFLDGVLDEYLNLYRICCQNRARIRRGLTQSIAIFEVLELDVAAKHDAELAAVELPQRLDTSLGRQRSLNPLQSWVRYYKLKIMAETVHLGFETDIYLPDEFAHMYWYLGTLLKKRRELVEHIEVFVLERANHLKRSGQTRHLGECLVSLQWYAALKAEMDISVNLASALHKLFSLLLHFSLLSVPTRSAGQPELLHEARMKVYLCVKDPAPPSAQDFFTASTLGSSADTTMQQIETHVRLAKTDLAALKTVAADTAKYIGTDDQWRATIKGLETTAVAILVAVTQLKRAQAKDAIVSLVMTIPPLEKRYHDWWTVPQLKEKR